MYDQGVKYQAAMFFEWNIQHHLFNSKAEIGEQNKRENLILRVSVDEQAGTSS